MTYLPTTSIGTPPRRGRQPLLPTLFDRLQDDNPFQPSAPPSAYAHTADTLRQSIRRDLSFLLNTLNADGLIDPATHPHAASSCLNFGIPPLAGQHVQEGQWQHVEILIREVVKRFEPRLDEGSLTVTPLPSREQSTGQGGGHLLRFEIRAQINAKPYPLAFLVQSAVDLETSRLGEFA